MNKKKMLMFLLILIIIGSCKTHKNNDLDNYVKHSLNSKEFLEFFRVCESKKDTVELYNDTTSVKIRSFSFINACDKHIIFKPINFKYDINSIKTSDKGIVFRYEYVNNKMVFSFIDTKSNRLLELEYNKKFEVTILSKGVI